MFASWQDIDWFEWFKQRGTISPLPRRKPDMAGGRYLINAVSAFDIETTRIDLPIPEGAKQNSHSFMYIWQFQIEDMTIIGRTWEDCFGMFESLRDACLKLGEEMGIELPPRLICFCHNLSYEWQFLQGLYQFKNEEVFLREPRKPIYCRMWDVIEIRCSYMQTNMSLSHFTRQMGVEQKLSGQEFDYNKTRYPWTELTEYELEYCVRDVRSLVAGMKRKLEMDGDTLQTIPLTATGYVRRDCKKAISKKPLCYDIRDMKPGVEEYKLLRRAFRGGNTHCSRRYSNKLIENVYSYDMVSCYPAMQITQKFPVKKFQFLRSNLDIERVMKYIGLGYAVVGRYIFENLRVKDNVPIPYISLAGTHTYDFITPPKTKRGKMESKSGGIDNGRVLYAGICETVLTEIDLEIIVKQYEFDNIIVKEAMIAKKDYLPEEYRNVVKKYYENKTVLKGAETEEELYLYAKDKAKLNSVYGMSCQDPIHSDCLYDNGDYNIRNLYNYPEEAKKALAKAPFPYQWGVYCTAYARKKLQEGIDLAGWDRMVYCDTDSIKVIGELDLSSINDKRIAVAKRTGAFATDRKGNTHYMGVFEEDAHYTNGFISTGAKRYAYIKGGCKYADSCPTYPKCKMGITVSGVSKKVNEKTGIPFAVEELGSLENFREGFEWKESAGTMAVYNDEDQFVYEAPDGSGSVVISPNVAILPTTYKMGFSKDYSELLTDMILYGEYVDKRS